MSNKKPLSKGLLILIGLGVIGISGMILAMITLTPSFKALSPMLKAANRGSVDDYETRFIPSSAMEPTLAINDRILIDKQIYQNALPKRGDLIIFNPVEELKEDGYTAPFIERVVGLPGETVEVKDGKVYINNRPIVEDYIVDPPKYTTKLSKIPDRSYYVLGDSRNNSYDSHYWGYVPEELIIGKAVSIYFPPSRVREFD